MSERHIDLIQRAAAKLKQAESRPLGQAIGVSFGSLALAHMEPTIDAVGQAKLAESVVRRSPDLSVDRGRLAQAGIAFPSDERSRLAEEFRVIKRQVLALAERQAAESLSERAPRLILVTSARPLEGKTFVATNLSLAIASEEDYRVLLIDCDPTRQTLGDLLGVGSKSGLGDLLHGDKTEIADILLHTDIPNLNVIPFGKRHANMPEMLSSNRMKGLLEEMGRRYSDRYIVLDAPPCLATSDAAILAPLVSQVIFVVEANRTQQQEIEEGVRLVRACPNISLVLNKADGNSPEQFGSHGYY